MTARDAGSLDGAIVLAVAAGWGARTVLQTGALDVLRAAGPVVVLTSEALARPLRERLPDDVAVETLAPFDPTAGRYGALYRRRNRHFLRLAMTATRHHNEQRVRAALAGRWRRRLDEAALRLEAALFASPERVRALIARESDAFLAEYPHRRAYEARFDAWRPRLVVSTVPHIATEAPPILLGRARGIPTAGWISSWDNLTSKPAYHATFDRYFVWSATMCDELDRYYPECTPDRRAAVGVPHFDWYRDAEMVWERARLCAHWNFDPARPILFYAAATPHLAPAEHLIVTRLADDLERHPAKTRPQLLVRLHPGDAGGRLREWDPPPHVRLDVPGAAGDGKLDRFCPSQEENQVLVNTVRHADVVVNLASTVTLEAAVCDRPTIGVAYDLRPGAPFQADIDAYYRDFDHFATVVRDGALRLVHSPEALAEAIDEALTDPDAGRAGRARAVERWCGPMDGRAGERLGHALVEAAGAAA